VRDGGDRPLGGVAGVAICAVHADEHAHPAVAAVILVQRAGSLLAS
jgi:hypothetical protein